MECVDEPEEDYTDSQGQLTYVANLYKIQVKMSETLNPVWPTQPALARSMFTWFIMHATANMLPVPGELT